MDIGKSKGGKKAIGMAMAAIIVASVFAMVAPVSVADPNVPPGKEARFFLVPTNSYVPSKCNDINVEVWLNVTNTTGVAGGAFNITYTYCCANITSFTPNKTFFDSFTFANPATTPGRLTVTFMNTSAFPACNQPKGVYHLGTFKIHCCSGICCRTNLTFVDKTEASNVPAAGALFALPTAVQNGTFRCGGPVITVNKTVWNGTAWVKEITDAAIGDNYMFRINVTANDCCNLTNVVVKDTLTGFMNINCSTVSPATPNCTANSIQWSLGKLNKSQTKTLYFNATVTNYGMSVNKANATGYCPKFGINATPGQDTVTVVAPIPYVALMYFKPRNSSASYCNTTEVEVWVNSSEPFQSGQINLTYNASCCLLYTSDAADE